MRVNAIVVVLLAATAVTGCQTSYRYPFFQSDNYYLVNFGNKGNCYTRIVESRPVDQVCKKRNRLRYTDTPEVDKFIENVPGEVLAVFKAQDRDRFRNLAKRSKMKLGI